MMQAAQDKLLVKYPCLSLTSAYIDGQWMKALSSFDDVCPTTEEVIVSVANCGASQVTEAVEAARRAFRIWGISPVSHRSQFLRRLADLIDRDRDDLATLESIDEGKPLRESLSDIGDAAGLARHLADLIEITDMEDVVVDNGTAEFKTSVLTEPLGVVAAITPWNYPFLMACQKSLTAIATGCTVILKPSELAPLSCLVLADLCHEAGLPDGVLNITPGLGSLTGEALSNACVDKVSFTGSLPTARKIMAAAALGPRAVSLELGGKSALIAFEDSDVSAAVDWIIMGFVWGSGQVCSATSRVLVHTNLLPKLLPALIAKLEKLSIGDPLIEGVNVGPVVNKAQYDKIWVTFLVLTLRICKCRHNLVWGYYADIHRGRTIRGNTVHLWRDKTFPWMSSEWLIHSADCVS
jgi:betaine-aldehyde dehydrogenase